MDARQHRIQPAAAENCWKNAAMSGPVFSLLSRDVTLLWLFLYCNEVKFSMEVLKFTEVALETEERSKVTKT